MQIAVDLLFADGRKESSIHDTSELTIGKAAPSTLVVPGVPELANVQLMVIPRSNGVWVSDSKDASVPALRGGRPHGSGLLAWGAELDIGSLSVRLRRHEERSRSSQSQPIFLVLLAVAMVAAAWFVLGRNTTPPIPTTNAAPPSLFEAAAASCDEPATAPARALRLVFEADNHEQRYPFAAQTGIAAARAYDVAAACFRAAGMEREHAGATARSTALKRSIELDYRTLISTQQRHLRRKDFAAALDVTRALRDLVAHKEGEYVTWLARLEAFLIKRTSSAKKSKGKGKEKKQ